jgi:hypothetical protein
MAKVIKDKRDGHIFAYDPKLLEKDYMEEVEIKDETTSTKTSSKDEKKTKAKPTAKKH